jgi:hypothetical protein
MNNDHAFWEIVYRSLMAIASAIKRYKLTGNNGTIVTAFSEVDTISIPLDKDS